MMNRKEDPWGIEDERSPPLSDTQWMLYLLHGPSFYI